MRGIGCSISFIFISGCADVWQWERPGGTESQLDWDKEVCSAQARAAVGPDGSVFDASTLSQNCLMERGWRQVEVKPTPRSD